jgi:exodeoxyribonuclease III
MRLISWNVNGRAADACAAQTDAVLGRKPDVVALQELTVGNYPQWCEALLSAGYSVVSAVDLVGVPYPRVEPPVRRKYFNAIAARGAIAPLPGLDFRDPDEARVAFPEKYVAVQITLDGVRFQVHNAHLPPGSTRGVIKPQAFRAIRRRTDRVVAPHVLCGDFNTPQSEDADGITTWAASGQRGADWDRAERGVLENPRLRDVYRELRPAGSPFAASHYTGATRRRYDHIYASPEFRATACRYHEAWLGRLSDHAAVEADFEPLSSFTAIAA